jgi:hypothetical protein
MNMKIIIRFFVLFIFSFCLAATFSQISVAKASGRGLVLSPLRHELEIAPGTSANGVLTVTNSTDKEMSVTLSTEVFTVINQQYDYAFTEDSEATKWVSFNPSKINLKANESTKVAFIVSVPLQSEPGGRYLSMFVSNNTTTSGNGLNYRQRIASLLYITVTGDVSREGHLLSLTSPWFITSDSIWSVALQNTGTTHYKSRYNVQIVNLLGGREVVSSELGESLILPGSVRSISSKMPLPNLPGVYKAVYTIGLGDNPAQIETRYILYTPTLFIVTLTIILAAAFIWLRFRKKIFKKNQSV